MNTRIIKLTEAEVKCALREYIKKHSCYGVPYTDGLAELKVNGERLDQAEFIFYERDPYYE
jgi:hypothetical protein